MKRVKFVSETTNSGVETEIKEKRGLELYTNQLYVIPKYLWKVIRQICNKPANDCNDELIFPRIRSLESISSG